MDDLMSIAKILLGMAAGYMVLSQKLAETRAWLRDRTGESAGRLRNIPEWKVWAYWAGVICFVGGAVPVILEPSGRTLPTGFVCWVLAGAALTYPLCFYDSRHDK